MVWRVLCRKRDSEGDDPTLIRHLHDLAALESLVVKNADFKSLVFTLFEKDSDRGKPKEEYQKLDKTGRIREAMRILEEDREYAVEYARFVDDVSYALAREQYSFKDALQAVRRIATDIF